LPANKYYLPIDLSITHCGILEAFRDAIHGIQQYIGTVPTHQRRT